MIVVQHNIDVLDRSFAPAAPGSRPGGLSPVELRRAATLVGMHPKVVGADVVEVSPPDDEADVTTMAAAQRGGRRRRVESVHGDSARRESRVS